MTISVKVSGKGFALHLAESRVNRRSLKVDICGQSDVFSLKSFACRKICKVYPLVGIGNCVRVGFGSASTPFFAVIPLRETKTGNTRRYDHIAVTHRPFCQNSSDIRRNTGAYKLRHIGQRCAIRSRYVLIRHSAKIIRIFYRYFFGTTIGTGKSIILCASQLD